MSGNARWRRLSLAIMVALAACAPPLTAGEPVASQAAASSSPARRSVYFAADVVPLLTRLGCNSGGCHGKATGQNGFKLSLLGFEPDLDYEAIVAQDRGRRLFLSAPQRSLLLLKATGAAPHGGGARLPVDSDDYRMLAAWIEQGAPPARPSDPTLVSISVSPLEIVLTEASPRQTVAVTASFSDGTSRDVTRQSVYQTNEPEIADATDQGSIETHGRCGLAAVMVRYGDQLATVRVTAPYSASGDPLASAGVGATSGDSVAGVNPVDRYLEAQWRRLRIGPSPPATDAEFIRRATLDICGALPTVEELTEYAADVRPDKRARLIDRLLDRPEYAAYFAQKWADVLQNRGRGYSTSRQREGTALFTAWIRDALAANMPYDRFVTRILTAAGSQQSCPPAVWYRSVRTTPDYVESVAQAFLGVRVQCAQCHHHPAERWSQDDYYALAAVFARVGRKGGFADAEVPTSEAIFLADKGEVLHPRTGRRVEPRPLGGPPFVLGRYDDPRLALARWMTAPGNPFFARTQVNRLWGHFLGRGIVHPIDDARSTNPPSNPELLDALSEEFAASGYDIKRLIRAICNSRAYAASCLPSESNARDVQSFARYYPRRLPAEVLLDAISQALGSPGIFSAGPGPFPLGTRAIELPDEAVPSQFLDVFGRPDRSSACECQRVDSPALGQMLALVSSKEVQDKLAAPLGYAASLAADSRPHEARVEEIFRRFFARQPRPEELQAACRHLAKQADAGEAYRSLLWSLLATNEFLFNH